MNRGDMKKGSRGIPARTLLLFLAAVVWAGELHVASAQGSETPETPAVRDLGEGIYKIGQVELDKNRRTVRFPAAINQVDGLIEYLLVGTKGKTHESLLRTDVSPAHVHVALLLLGFKVVSGNSNRLAPPPALDSAYLAAAPLPEGIPITITLEWHVVNGELVSRRAESLIDNLQTRAPMSEGAWIYNGSMFAHGRFLAMEELSFAAVVTDPAALMNNPRPGHDNDQIWSLSPEHLPPLNTAVDVIIQVPALAP